MNMGRVIFDGVEDTRVLAYDFNNRDGYWMAIPTAEMPGQNAESADFFVTGARDLNGDGQVDIIYGRLGNSYSNNTVSHYVTDPFLYQRDGCQDRLYTPDFPTEILQAVQEIFDHNVQLARGAFETFKGAVGRGKYEFDLGLKFSSAQIQDTLSYGPEDNLASLREVGDHFTLALSGSNEVQVSIKRDFGLSEPDPSTKLFEKISAERQQPKITE